MTRYLAITTCNKDQWESFGRAMATTFVRHWPEEIMLCLYAEEFDISSDSEARVQVVDLYTDAPWLRLFKVMYRDPRYNGGPHGRDYRHDAVRFAHKIAAIGAAAEDADCDVLIWMDADIVTHAPVTCDWLDGLFPEPAVIAWLDRERSYPECGFLMFRMPDARPVINTIVKAYRKGKIFNLREWHDSFVIQHYVEKSTIKVHSLSGPVGRKHIGHPFVASDLGSRMDHLKGERRKSSGRSSIGTELKHTRTEPYWR